jgi:hypothetical protein
MNAIKECKKDGILVPLNFNLSNIYRLISISLLKEGSVPLPLEEEAGWAQRTILDRL